MSSDLTNFGLTEMLRCGSEIRRVTKDAPTLETAAQRICRLLYDELAAPRSDGSAASRACALVRFYKTHPFVQLPMELQRFAKGLLGPEPPHEDMKSLALMATVGDEPAWNTRRRSKGHQAIPLASPEMVEKAPMIAQLIRAFGLELSTFVRPTRDVVRDLGGKSYGVFHVEQAVGSPYIPAQEFVRQHRIRSVLGFGGSLATGDLFAVILFSRVPISVDAADRFRTVALDVKGTIFSFREDRSFDGVQPAAV